MTSYAAPPEFRREEAVTLLSPGSTGEGHWIGAPCVHRYDGRRLVAVRERTPAERGHAVRLYTDDGEDLSPVTTITASDLGVVSVERAALVTDPRTKRLRLYLPVDHGANDWTIQLLDPVEDPAALDPATARDVLAPRAGTTDCVTVKDPAVLTVGGRYYMYYAGHDGVSEQAHLATSVDGEDWQRAGENPVLGRQYWHDHHTRISAVVPARDAPVWHVFYEGSSSVDDGETWNLRTGTAVSPDLESVVDTTPDGPLFDARGTDGETGLDDFGTFRYVDLIADSLGTHAYYEVARDDGSFELRRAPLDGAGERR